MNYNSLNIFKSSFKHLFLFVTLILIGWGCTGEPKPVYSNEVITTIYPEMAEAITERDEETLLEYVDHPNKHVRSLAWRALAKSEIKNIQLFFDTVLSKNEAEGWFSLSYVTLQSGQINRIKQLLASDPSRYRGSCEIFRRQGGGEDVHRLLSILHQLEDKRRCATAVGTILSREQVSENSVRQTIESSFNSENITVRRNLLYGFYRSAINRPVPGTELYELIKKKWSEAGVGKNDYLDQYMIQILGEEGTDLYLNNMGEIDEIKEIDDIQLLIELARSLQVREKSTDQQRDLIKELLNHKSPHVVVQTLERLKQQQTSDEQLLEFIYGNITVPTRNHEIFLTSLEYLQQNGVDISKLMEKIAFSELINPYLANRVLGIYKQLESNVDYLQRIKKLIKTGGIRGMHAVRMLTEYWIEGGGIADSSEIHQIVKETVQSGELSTLSALNKLLTDGSLISENDYSWIYTAYSEAAEKKVEDNTIVLEQVLEARFPDRFERLTDGRVPDFRIPDWDRLYALGTRPVWQLETEKGIIDIRLDPLSAPFTVSSIDSLTRAGNYNGVAFHRIVRNFVVQGGDFIRRDGFGSPDHTIPTEPSFHSFNRGTAGIASSGTDTEGSQYFFMHQWAPHLDGDYTLFGEVVRGMDVVDRLQIGDNVNHATISIR